MNTDQGSESLHSIGTGTYLHTGCNRSVRSSNLVGIVTNHVLVANLLPDAALPQFGQQSEPIYQPVTDRFSRAPVIDSDDLANPL